MAFVYRGNQAAADSLVQEVKESDGTALALQADVTDANAAFAPM